MSIRDEMLLMMADPEIGMNITLRWNEFIGTPTTDPITGSQIGDIEVKTDTVRCLFYEVRAATYERKFAEIQAGDAIVDLPPSTVIDGRDGLEFVITKGTTEEVWVQKKLGGRIASIRDAPESGEATALTILLERKT